MKRLSQLILCVALTGIISEAADLITKSGQVYKNFEVVKVKEDGLQIFHDSGSASIPFAELPDDLRGKYRQEEEHLVLMAKQEREQKAVESELEKISLIGLISIVQIINSNSALVEYKDSILLLVDLPTAGLVDGIAVKPNSYSKYHVAKRYRSGNIYHYVCKYCPTTIWLGGEKGDDDPKERRKCLEEAKKQTCGPYLEIWEIGTYSYIGTDNAKKTVPKYTYSREKALEFLRRTGKIK